MAGNSKVKIKNAAGSNRQFLLVTYYLSLTTLPGKGTKDYELQTKNYYASPPSHSAPLIELRAAPVTDASTLYSSRQRSTPINAITSASL